MEWLELGMVQENLFLKETECIISEIEEESWEKNVNQNFFLGYQRKILGQKEFLESLSDIEILVLVRRMFIELV